MVYVVGLVCIIVGFAVGHTLSKKRYIDMLSQKEIAEDELADVSKLFSKTKENYDRLAQEYHAVYKGYQMVSQQNANLQAQQEQLMCQLQQMKQAKVPNQQQMMMTHQYENAAFEYTKRIQEYDMMRKENQILTTQVEVQRKRLRELEGENVNSDRYKALVNYAKSCKIQIKALQGELQTLKNKKIDGFVSADTTQIKNITGKGTITNICRQILNSVTLNKSSLGAVFADEMGLPISSTTQFANELAEISMIHQYCNSVLEKELKFGTLTRITLKNANSILCTIMPCVINNQKVFYTGLSRPSQDTKSRISSVTDAVLLQ